MSDKTLSSLLLNLYFAMFPSQPQCIGIYDSGVGGLTLLRSLRQRAPYFDYLYFADTAHLPYGEKSGYLITQQGEKISQFLLDRGATMLVIACHTATLAAFEPLKQRFSIPLFGMVQPGLTFAVKKTKQCLGILTTRHAIRSQKYHQALQGLPIDFIVAAAPLLVPMIEEGMTSHPITRAITKEYLAPLIEKKIDTLLLACTHYPWIGDLFSELLGKNIHLIDPSDAMVDSILATLPPPSADRTGTCQFYVSDYPNRFTDRATSLLNFPLGKVEQVHLSYSPAILRSSYPTSIP